MLGKRVLAGKPSLVANFPQGTSMNYSALIKALIAVESGGRADAVGDNGKALGILQIWDIVVRDVNQIYGTRYKWRDALDPLKARVICTQYLKHYGRPELIGKMDPYEANARIWNGGPNGHHKAATVPYWNKVKAHLTLSTHP